jgi:hypothetical protein
MFQSTMLVISTASVVERGCALNGLQRRPGARNVCVVRKEHFPRPAVLWQLPLLSGKRRRVIHQCKLGGILSAAEVVLPHCLP